MEKVTRSHLDNLWSEDRESQNKAFTYIVSHIRLATCLAVIFALFARPSIARACSCMADVTIPDNFTMHNAVFTGKVVRIVDNYVPFFSTLDLIAYKLGKPTYFFYKFSHNEDRRLGFSVFFKVFNSWKGVDSTVVMINTGRGGGDCGYTFMPNEEYLVYANYAYGIPNNYWVTGTCSRNSILTDNLEDLNYLNSKPSLLLRYSPPIFWTEKDSIIFALIFLPTISVIILRRKFRRNL